jgi:hypothetical protein
LKCGELLVAVPKCVVADSDYLEMLLATLKKHWLYFAEAISAPVQDRPVMHPIFAFRDVDCLHI